MMDRFAEATANDARTQSHTSLRTRLHPHCVVCSPDDSRGLCLRFVTGADDTVGAEFELDQAVEVYVGWLHGGITSAVLDGAMTDWLFAHGLTGVTAELSVRFRHPVILGEPAKVTARLKSASHPLYVLEACIMPNGQLKVRATGRFMYREYGADEQ
jgi:acyl-coenzyme A thioesterase PaaI-like protein